MCGTLQNKSNTEQKNQPGVLNLKTNPAIQSPKVQREDQEKFGLKPQCDNRPGMLKLMATPVVISTLQNHFSVTEKMWKLLCDDAEKIWASGNNGKIIQIDRKGAVLMTFDFGVDVAALSFGLEQELGVIARWPHRKIYQQYSSNRITVRLELKELCPRGLNYATNGDLLVSMRSVDKSQSRVVRYKGTTETKVIQKDNHNRPLFSIYKKKLLPLTQNGNSDICVSDVAGRSIVVVDHVGQLRFKYLGNISKHSKYRTFIPCDIATDANYYILINDSSNDIVHVMDQDGRFLCYIEYPCNGGLCVDINHDLVVGEENTGKIRFIKYLQ